MLLLFHLCNSLKDYDQHTPHHQPSTVEMKNKRKVREGQMQLTFLIVSAIFPPFVILAMTSTD